MEIIFFVIAFVSEILGTVAGFGSSTIALPISLFFFDFKTALVLVAFMHIFGNIGRINFFKKGLDKNILLKFGLTSVIFTLLGAALVAYISPEVLKGVLGLFLISYVLLFWKDKLNIRPTDSLTIIGGGLS